VRWLCNSRRGVGLSGVLTSPSGDYLGHVLELATTGEQGDLWIGWRCVHCGDRFAMPDEPDRYDLPLMELVETEELPTEAREAAALLWAMCASNPPIISSDAVGALHGGAPQYDEESHRFRLTVSGLAGHAWFSTYKLAKRIPDKTLRYALAESLVRNGEV